MKFVFVLSTFLLVAVVVGCSSQPSVRDRYENLDYDSKSVFLAYYPYLTPDERDELLADPLADPRKLIESWSGELNDPDHEVGSFDEMMSSPLNHRITDLRIELGANEPVTAGNRVPLHAFAKYATQARRRVEVTPDADWHVDSSLARIDRDGRKVNLEFDCVSSDVTVTANFLGERDTSRTLQIRKPLESLELKVNEAYIGIDSGYNFRLTLIAHCKDGTSSDVSCQADWSSASDAGTVAGCGNFTIRSREKLEREAAMTITARYGGLSLRKTLHPPVR